jgi:hypothetical protein
VPGRGVEMMKCDWCHREYFLSQGDSCLHHSVKDKAIPVTGYGGPWGCDTLRLAHFIDSQLTDGSDVSLTRWPPFYPKEDS